MFSTFKTALIKVNYTVLFFKKIKQELDFNLEIENSVKTAENFKGDPNVHIPYTYKEYSSSRIITMEYISNAAKVLSIIFTMNFLCYLD